MAQPSAGSLAQRCALPGYVATTALFTHTKPAPAVWLGCVHIFTYKSNIFVLWCHFFTRWEMSNPLRHHRPRNPAKASLICPLWAMRCLLQLP